MRRPRDQDRRETGSAAFIWDFDGTLVDTRHRNYHIVCRLLLDAAGTLDPFPALRSPETYDRIQRRYVNWRDLYVREFGFTEAETDRLGSLWGEYQLRDQTPAPVFVGVADALADLGPASHGVVSQNARDQIARVLAQAGIRHYFRAIVGYEDVHLQRQKPAPDGFLACLEQLDARATHVLYIGDHETDVRCARNAQRALAERGSRLKVVAVAARFVDHGDPGGWSERPDYVARSPSDIVRIAEELDRGQ